MRSRSVTVMYRIRLTSQSANCGPANSPLLTVPNVPAGFVENACGLRKFLQATDTPVQAVGDPRAYGSTPVARTARSRFCPVPELLGALETTVRGSPLRNWKMPFVCQPFAI